MPRAIGPRNAGNRVVGVLRLSAGTPEIHRRGRQSKLPATALLLPARMRHMLIRRAIDQQPIHADLCSDIGKSVELDRLARVAIGTKAIALFQIGVLG